MVDWLQFYDNGSHFYSNGGIAHFYSNAGIAHFYGNGRIAHLV